MTTHTGLVDAFTAAGRILTKLRHDPGSIIVTIATPVALVLIFGYVFGGAMTVPSGGNYREFLVPGLFVMMAINVVPIMVGTARDQSRGVIDRFRSLPIARSVVPAGQVIAHTGYLAVNLGLMAACGVLVGWRARTGLGHVAAAFGLLLLLGFAFHWFGTWLGLVVRNEEAAGQFAVLILPVSMLSNIFVPTAGMPSWLRAVCDWNPASAAAAAARDLLGNPESSAHSAWPLQHPVAATLVWSAAILAVFAPLATARYARTR